MICFNHVSKKYPPDLKVLKRINLHIKPGEFISVVGQSGAGKTTMVKLLIAEEKPSQGRLVIGGWDVTNIKSDEVPTLRRQIGVVFQDFKLLQQRNVFENVAFALEVVGIKTSKIPEIVDQTLKLVGLEDKKHNFPSQLSGGEQQRVVVARAVAHQPKILIADEPTGNLDAINAREIVELLKKINDFGTTVMLVTHNREVVNHIKRRVVVLEQGQIISDKEKGKYLL